MSIDDRTPPAVTVRDWRAVMHDLVDDVLDRMLLTAEAEWEQDTEFDAESDDEWWWADDEEPPGDPPEQGPPVPALGAALNAGLVAEIERGTGFWGCDGTLRCTDGWARQILDRPDGLLDVHRRQGRFCDCAVLHHALGRGGPAPRCPSDPVGGDPQEPGSGSCPAS